MHRSIENSHDDLYLDPGPAAVLFVSRYRAMPGRAGDYMRFVRTEMYPPPPVAKTLGPRGTTAFLAKGAGLITQLDQSILRRLPDLSF